VAEILLDSGLLLAHLCRGRTPEARASHRRADAAIRGALGVGGRFVTTNLVVAETHQLLLIRDTRATGLAFLRQFPDLGAEVIASSRELEARAIGDWIERYHDHDFSLCDAVSFVVMKERGIRRALTFDRHFAAAGFEMLPA